ncbi:MAG: fused MFS/spermidine synthase [Sterolibacterium sp.]
MSVTNRCDAVTSAATAVRPFLPLLVLLFVGSGCAALIYEVVWLQMMSLIIGSSAISIGLLLGIYMGGMCAGSLLLSRFISRHAHPLRVYALLEVGIGVCGIVVLWIMPYIGGLYTEIAVHGTMGILLRGLFCVLCLLPPTLLMGATLPAIARWVEATPKGVAWLGFFYGGNIAGAVIGCLLAGYYLLRVHDVATATFVAVTLNASVACAGLILSQRTSYHEPAGAPSTGLFAMPAGSASVYLAIGLSGFTALAAEVVWTRLLSLNLGATTYTFSLILAVFLLGLGIGSSLGALVVRRGATARTMLGGCQLLLAGGLAWAAYSLTQVLPLWPFDPNLSPSPLTTFQSDLIKTLITVLPGAFLWGASFPLALAAIGIHDRDPGVVVGTTYAANTVGAIFGALLMSLVFIPEFGSQRSQQLLIVCSTVAALLMLVFSTEGLASNGRGLGRWGVALLMVLATGWLVQTVIPVPPLLVGYGRFAARQLHDHGEFIYVGEGMNSSMTVSVLPNGVLSYHNAGKVQASSEPQDMRLQRMLGHMATLLPTQAPKSVLVIGCGAGVTAGAVSLDPRLEREVIAEIEPLVPRVVSTYFRQHNFDVVGNPKVRVEVDDARHYLFTTKEKFDAITSDPFDPWVKGAANLYTREFFQLVKDRLNPGGVVTVFVQLYMSNMEAVKSEVATFLEAFPEGLIFANKHKDAGYDIVLVGQATPGPIDVDAIQERLSSSEYAPVVYSMREIGMHTAVDLLSTFAMRGKQLKPWLADAQINTDRNLRLQYLAGFGLNTYDQARIYAEMAQYRKYPEGLFTGSPQQLERLRVRME